MKVQEPASIGSHTLHGAAAGGAAGLAVGAAMGGGSLTILIPVMGAVGVVGGAALGGVGGAVFPAPSSTRDGALRGAALAAAPIAALGIWDAATTASRLDVPYVLGSAAGMAVVAGVVGGLVGAYVGRSLAD